MSARRGSGPTLTAGSAISPLKTVSLAKPFAIAASFAVAAALALAGATPAAAQQDEQTAEAPPTVRVSASGTVEVPPDRAILLLAVENRADSARQAAAANAERTQAVLRALDGLGLSGDRVRTAGYRLEPIYVRPDRPPRPQPGQQEPEGPRLVGYRATNAVQVTVDSLPRVGAVIDAGIGAGANRVAGLSFDVRDAAAPRAEAVRRAVEAARSRAEAAAAAAGARLGAVMEIHLVEDRPMPFRARTMEMAAADMAVETPVEPGVLDVTETVTVVWRLEGG